MFDTISTTISTSMSTSDSSDSSDSPAGAPTGMSGNSDDGERLLRCYIDPKYSRQCHSKSKSFFW